MTEFIPGLELSESLFKEAVQPIMNEFFPGLQYAAGLLGWGSDALGYDTPVSRDHFWGPRMVLFLDEDRISEFHKQVNEVLRNKLPREIRGYSTHFGKPDVADGGTRKRALLQEGPVDHLIEITTIPAYWQREIHYDIKQTPSSLDWLTFPEQRLLALTSGEVFHDEIGLQAMRDQFAYYPHDVWLYLLASQWALIAQEEAFVGRTNQVGDELGSRVITARLVERIIHLCFLMEKRYAPYSKWLGVAFMQLNCFEGIHLLLKDLLDAKAFSERDELFAKVYLRLVKMHNLLKITEPLEEKTRTYSAWHALREGIDNLALDDERNTRPFQVVFAERIRQALWQEIQDPELLSIGNAYGSVNQFLVESSDALQCTTFCHHFRNLLKSINDL
jgi:hypothetical protein